MKKKIRNYLIGIGIDSSKGERISLISNEICGDHFENVSEEKKEIIIKIKKIPLNPGKYAYTLFSSVNGDIADWIQNAGFFYIESGDYYKTGKTVSIDQGTFLLDYAFRIK